MLLQWISFLPIVVANFGVSLDKDSYSADDTVTVSWMDDGTAPTVSSFSTADFVFCTYDASQQMECKLVIGKGVTISGSNSYTFDLSSVKSLGASGSYLLQMASYGSTGADNVVNYAAHFVDIQGFSGPGVATTGWIPKLAVASGVGATDLAGGGTALSVPSEYQGLPSPWMTPYQYQQGVTRYAPFQLTPNSSATAPRTPTRRFPTSSASIFTTWIRTPLPATTLTPSPSITISLAINEASSYTPQGTGRRPARVTPVNLYRPRRWE